mmetsp:Transcript_3509/g.9154  ORF Transcript_3509/g.9154 Transcript_3509/m.9154 type:complete len:304 (-) Transcript_3509:171-1082(-)
MLDDRAVSSHGDDGNSILEQRHLRHDLLRILGRVLARDFLGPLAHGDPRRTDLGHVVGELLPDGSKDRLLLPLDVSPLLVGEEVAVVRDAALELEGEVVDGVEFEIVMIPEVVPPRVQVLSVNGDDLGVVPRNALSPCANPKTNVGILRQIRGKLLPEAVAIDGHPDDVPEHHPNMDRLLLPLGLLAQRLESLLELIHEYSVGRAEAHHVAPYLGPRHNVGHDLGEPIVVTVLGNRRARPRILGSLVQFSHDPSGRDVPQRVVIVVVLGTEDFVRGVPHVGEVALGVVVLDLLPGGVVGFAAA